MSPAALADLLGRAEAFVRSVTPTEDEDGDWVCWMCEGRYPRECAECGGRFHPDLLIDEECPRCGEEGEMEVVFEFEHEAGCQAAALLRDLAAAKATTETETKQEATA